MKINLIALSYLFLACGAGSMKSYDNPISSGDNTLTQETPKNIILLIGDGMGLTQVSSAFYYKETIPNFSRFEDIGLIRTSSSREKITDSAAGATAFASGVKTYNGAVGVDDDTLSVPTIVEILSERNWKSGVIATSSITHATPACFYAHVRSRGMEEEIAVQLLNSDIDFFAGGGKNYFDPNNKKIKKDLVSFDSPLEDVKLVPNRRHGFVLSDEGMPPVLEGRGDFLPRATRKALNYFSLSEDNFFLMVEGSQIDWGGHSNNEEYLVSELIDFDEMIGVALDFAEEDGNTLVIVTADHETGGYTLAPGSNYNEIVGSFSTGGHSTTLIPVFAYGPGSENFRGIYENTEIFHKMMELTSSTN